MTTINKGGRPLKFKSVKKLQASIDDYFESCFEIETDEEGKEISRKQVRPFTVTGLALHLDTTRRTLLDYERRDKFSHTIKRAKTKIEAYLEKQLFRTANVTGIIFNLKNNFKWRDQQDVKHDGKLTLEDIVVGQSKSEKDD